MPACKLCGKFITWELTVTGKRAPMNAGGTSHFQTCSAKKEQLKQVRAEARAAESAPAPAKPPKPTKPPLF